MESNITYESARNNKTFKSVLNGLIVNQFCQEYDYKDKSIQLSEIDLRKAGWIASLLALSPIENHKFIAASFAKLLYLLNKTDEQKTKLAYTILSRTGNLAATELLKSLFTESRNNDNKAFKNSFGAALDIELGAKRNSNRVKVPTNNKTYFVTDFQKKLWESLQVNDHVAISAPTSAGKSLFTQQFIATLMLQKEEFYVIYIVPSKALISQVSEDFTEVFKNHKDVVIRTAFIDKERLRYKKKNEVDQSIQNEQQEKKVIYCVTPERCLKLLQEGWKNLFRPDLIFIDEIQKIETDDNRGVLLEYVLSEIYGMWAGAKIITAGPFIDNGPDLFKELLFIPAEDVSTFLPAVYQLRLTLKAIEHNKSKILIHLRKNEVHEIELGEDIEIDLSQPTKFFIASVVLKFGKSDGNLIYSPKTDWCEAYATEFIKHLFIKNSGRVKDLDVSITELIQFLKAEIHEHYFLIYCLQHKVAFHHGKLPDIVKNEIEYLFKESKIEYLFCTSTLLEGVNLPAPRMFIADAKKGSRLEDLTEFDFGNLIGRAGRIGYSLAGTIFCLEKEPSNNWSDKYYNTESYTKSVVPMSRKAIKKEGKESVFQAMQREPIKLLHTGAEYTGNLLKHKYLVNPKLVIPYLNSKGLNSEKAIEIYNFIEKSLINSSITYEIARLNPSIDPVLQNILFEKIKKDGIEKWVLIDEENGNENYNTAMVKEIGRELPYSQKPFYYQFEHLLVELDKIFAISKEAWIKRATMTSVYLMTNLGVNWLQGATIHSMIAKEIKNDKKRNPEKWNGISKEREVRQINKCISTVINNNQTVVTYILVKYTKILADILESQMTAVQKEKYHKTLSLPTMLELGTRKIDVLIMISVGIPRTLALKISNYIPVPQRAKPVEWLLRIITIKELPLERFYIKYLYRRGYLPNLNKDDITTLLK